MNKMTVFQIGARRNYIVPEALNELNMLESLQTDFAFSDSLVKKELVEKLPKFGGKLAGRMCSVEQHDIKTVAFTMLNYYLKRKYMPGVSNDDAVEWLNNQMINRPMVTEGKNLYCFNTAALDIFERYKLTAENLILDQTSNLGRREFELYKEGLKLFPKWRSQFNLNENVFLRNDERNIKECEISNGIICGSNFIREDLISEGVDKRKIIVVPYGLKNLKTINIKKKIDISRKIRVLTVGRFSLAKGAPFLIEASKELRNDFEFRWVGEIDADKELVESAAKLVNLTGKVDKTMLSKHFTWADIFILPSLFEGSAMVTYEALSAGIPVICTHNSGSIIKSGINGLLIDAFSSKEITESLIRLMNDYEHYQLNVIKLRSELSFSTYTQRLKVALSSVLK